MTTDSDANSYVKDGKLYITPTLTEDTIGRDNVLNGYTYNLTSCTNLISGKSRLPFNGPKNFFSPRPQMAKVAGSSTLTPAVPFPTAQAGRSFHLSCQPACILKGARQSSTLMTASRWGFDTEFWPKIRQGYCTRKASKRVSPPSEVHHASHIVCRDWLWPAIWMLPVNDTYGMCPDLWSWLRHQWECFTGPWPMSGEIDIMESRGNDPSYPKQ
jgi:hypothetical protein